MSAALVIAFLGGCIGGFVLRYFSELRIPNREVVIIPAVAVIFSVAVLLGVM